MTTDPVLRRADPADAGAIAELWLRSFDAAMPTVRRAHTDAEVHGWVRQVLIPRHEVWVAALDAGVVGVLAMSPGWLDQLYVHPDWQRRGIGDRLVSLAKDQQPSGLQLWTFQVNEPARHFYERHGFVAVERTDGSGNEEREPDVRYLWRPSTQQPSASEASTRGV